MDRYIIKTGSTGNSLINSDLHISKLDSIKLFEFSNKHREAIVYVKNVPLGKRLITHHEQKNCFVPESAAWFNKDDGEFYSCEHERFDSEYIYIVPFYCNMEEFKDYPKYFIMKHSNNNVYWRYDSPYKGLKKDKYGEGIKFTYPLALMKKNGKEVSHEEALNNLFSKCEWCWSFAKEMWKIYCDTDIIWISKPPKSNICPYCGNYIKLT